MISLELSQDLKFISGLKSHSDFKRPLTFFQILGDLMENIARRHEAKRAIFPFRTTPLPRSFSRSGVKINTWSAVTTRLCCLQ